ncbi:hypothetical protein [Promicromonospora iranensis]|uniref:Uncharacterized protein n=1 Tax=Promicromonospora iranensis TaxID=1105144 RepID=A0ABU2CIL8_9MICO|nr:hypothetical protein [Promicromonospora iranensis]MDR7381169.1 hypothetical protein [Promicromonospora iranensis]
MTQTLERASLNNVLTAVVQILDVVGEEQIGSMTFSSGAVIAIQPSHLEQGEAIARALGLTSFIEHTSVVPAVTDWSGTWAGAGQCEIHVRGMRPRGAAVS